MIDRAPKDNFLSDPDKLHYRIYCINCKAALWETKILKRSGSKVLSTETKSCDESVPKFDRRMENCPLCKNVFYARSKNGNHLYHILDLNSGIKRLI